MFLNFFAAQSNALTVEIMSPRLKKVENGIYKNGPLISNMYVADEDRIEHVMHDKGGEIITDATQIMQIRGFGFHDLYSRRDQISSPWKQSDTIDFFRRGLLYINTNPHVAF